MNEATGGATTPADKARHIYAWVRDHFTCTEDNRLYMDGVLKTVLKNRKGSEAEINLLLTAMLRESGLAANPVILSTRSHGYAHPVYPIMERFNYVVSRLEIDGKAYYLDASEPLLGFGRLHYQCYNGHARIVNAEATPINLNAESLKEESLTSVFIINDEKGNSIGSFKQTPGYVESMSLREEVKDKGMDAFVEKIKKKHGSDFLISNFRVDSLSKYDDPVSVQYDIDFAGEKPDIIYFNPMFSEGYKENPFKSAKRVYPVEMPFAIDETFTLQMEVPKGYIIDEMPKQAIVKFNEVGDAYFEYRISHSNNMISLRSKLQIKKTFFQPEDYEILREFFNLIVSKHNEQIVFKKQP
jgi:hypothetical protein